jgi:FMN phosphatase YigB (HAD superfamily)
VIKAIFFDYDGVLTRDKTGSLTTNLYLSRMANVEYETVRNVFSQYNHDLLLGKITHREIWEAACEAMHREIDFSLLEQAFLSTAANDPMFALARRLKQNYALGSALLDLVELGPGDFPLVGEHVLAGEHDHEWSLERATLS